MNNSKGATYGKLMTDYIISICCLVSLRSEILEKLKKKQSVFHQKHWLETVLDTLCVFVC